MVSPRDFLHQAGLMYWLAHDAYDQVVADAYDGELIRMPSVAPSSTL